MVPFALSTRPGSAQRQRYIFRDGRDGGTTPPNNWVSVFGGPAWTRVTEPDGTPGQWYLHLFDSQQPDLNWDNPAVFEDLETTLRFWLDRGVDGFPHRRRARHGQTGGAAGHDQSRHRDAQRRRRRSAVQPRWCASHSSGHPLGARRLPHAVSIGEIWVFDNEDFAKYLRPDELHMGFNFRLVRT